MSPQDTRKWPTRDQGLAHGRQAMLEGLQSAGQDQSPGTAGVDAKIILGHQCPTGGATMATGKTLTSQSVSECLFSACTRRRASWRRSLASLVLWRSARLCWMATVAAAEDLHSSTLRQLTTPLRLGRH